MRNFNSLIVLWDYEIERCALAHNAVSRPLFQAQRKMPHKCTFCSKSNISNICNFGWHEWFCYREFGSFPENKEKLGLMLGPCKNEGNEMSQSIAASRGYVITLRTVRSLQSSELYSETDNRKRTLFDDVISVILCLSPQKPMLVSMLPVCMVLIHILLRYLKIMTLSYLMVLLF